jgi:hypothetical protein
MSNLVDRFVANGVTYTFPPVVKSLSDNFTNVVTRTVRLPGMDGGFDTYGSGRLPTEIGNIQLSFTLMEDWAVRTYGGSQAEAMQAARDALNKTPYLGLGKLYIEAGSDERWAWCKVNNINMPKNHDRNTHLWQPVSMDLQAALPYWFELGTEVATAWGEFVWGDGTTWGGAAVPQVAVGTATQWTVTYSGNAPTPVRIVIGVKTGDTAENVTVQRLVSGSVVDEVGYAGVLAALDELQIHSRAKKVQINGSDAYDDNFTYESPDWLVLEPGNNTIKVIMANPGDEVDVYLYYFEAYR